MCVFWQYLHPVGDIIQGRKRPEDDIKQKMLAQKSWNLEAIKTANEI